MRRGNYDNENEVETRKMSLETLVHRIIYLTSLSPSPFPNQLLCFTKGREESKRD